MIYQPKEVILKNGVAAIFRSPTKEDAMQMLEDVEPEEVEEVEDEEVEGLSEGEKETQQAVLDMLDELLKELDN